MSSKIEGHRSRAPGPPAAATGEAREASAPAKRLPSQPQVRPRNTRQGVPGPLSKAEQRLADMFRPHLTVLPRPQPARDAANAGSLRHPQLEDRGTEETIRRALQQQSGMAIRTKPGVDEIEFAAPPPPRAARKLLTTPLGAEPQAPIPVRLEAERQLRALERKHSKVKLQLEQVVAQHAGEAARLESLAREDAKRGVFREGLEGAVWHHEHQATLAKGLLRELEIEHQAARYAFDALVGGVSGPGLRQGDAKKTASPGAGSTAERFAERLARYNRSVEGIKSSGVIAPLTTLVPLAAAMNGKGFLDDEHRRTMDGLYQLGQIANIPLDVRGQRTSGAHGAAPPAPGVDHRRPAEQRAPNNPPAHGAR